MKFFRIRYKQGNRRGSLILEAPNKLEAMGQFKEQSLGVPLSITPTAEPLMMRLKRLIETLQSPIKNRKVRDEPYIAFLDQLSTMLDAGIPINFCLSECISDTEDPLIKSIFAEVLANIESGQGLTQSLHLYEKQLGNLSLSMFQLGEQTGTLNQAIAKLSAMLQEIYENRQMLKKATRYPLFIIIAMSIAFTVVITFVVPQFQSFFEQSQLELPFPTKLLLWTEHAITQYGPYILGGGIILASVFSYAYSKNETLKIKTDQYFLKIYIVGKVTYYAMIGRFIYLFDVLTEAGIPIIEALEVALGVVDNSYMKQELKKIALAIEDGRTLTQGFSDTGQFEGMILQMVKAGEQSGAMAKMLGKVTHVYQNRYRYIVDNIATMIEPILIAAIAGFVLILALGIFLPMWHMVDIAG